MLNKSVLTVRLAAISLAQERSRLAFFLTIAASAIVFVICFNFTFSQGRDASIMEEPSKDFSHRELKKEQVKHFEDQFYYSLPILGIQVNTSDLVFFGPLGLLIFSFYYVSCLKSALLQLADLDEQLKTESDEAIKEKVAVVIKSQIVLNAPNTDLPFDGGAWQLINRALKTVNLYKALIYVPAAVAAFAVAVDIRSVFFLPPSDMSSESALFYTADFPRKTVIFFELLGALLTLVVFLYGVAAARYSRSALGIIRRLTTR